MHIDCFISVPEGSWLEQILRTPFLLYIVFSLAIIYLEKWKQNIFTSEKMVIFYKILKENLAIYQTFSCFFRPWKTDYIGDFNPSFSPCYLFKADHNINVVGKEKGEGNNLEKVSVVILNALIIGGFLLQKGDWERVSRHLSLLHVCSSHYVIMDRYFFYLFMYFT